MFAHLCLLNCSFVFLCSCNCCKLDAFLDLSWVGLCSTLGTPKVRNGNGRLLMLSSFFIFFCNWPLLHPEDYVSSACFMLSLFPFVVLVVAKENSLRHSIAAFDAAFSSQGWQCRWSLIWVSPEDEEQGVVVSASMVVAMSSFACFSSFITWFFAMFLVSNGWCSPRGTRRVIATASQTTSSCLSPGPLKSLANHNLCSSPFERHSLQ